MDEEKQEVVIVCLRVAGANPSYVSDGAIKKTCSKCGEQVWFSVQGQEHLKQRPEAQLVCLTCIKPEITERIKQGEPIKGVPGSMAAAIDHLRKLKTRNN
jgi:hypothetical protein